MNNHIKQFIILALMLAGSITAWATTKTITYNMVWTLIFNPASEYYSLNGNNGETHNFGNPDQGDLENPLVVPFQDFTLTVTSSDSKCHIARFTTGQYGFYGHGYAFKFESTNYYITHVTVGGVDGASYRSAEANQFSKSCTLNFPYDNVVIKHITVTLTDELDIANTTVSGIADSYDYTGSAITPLPSVKYGNTDLTNGTDYTISYTNNLNAGTATMTLTGKGVFTGTWSTTFKINKVASAVNTVPTVGETTTYDGTTRALCTVGAATGGTLEYSTDHKTWSTTVPTATTAGNYSVFYRVTGDQNHTDLLSKKAGTVAIEARQTDYGTITVTDGYSSNVSNTAVISDGTDEVSITADIVVGSVTMQRTFTPGKAATVMLPFDIAASKVSGGTFYGFIGVDKDGTTGWEVYMSEVNRVSGTLQAHTPYLFMPTATTMTFNLDGQTVTLKANSEQTYTVKP
jgi:hypothetical protein